MVILNNKSEDSQSPLNLSSGEHECIYKIQVEYNGDEKLWG